MLIKLQRSLYMILIKNLILHRQQWETIVIKITAISHILPLLFVIYQPKSLRVHFALGPIIIANYNFWACQAFVYRTRTLWLWRCSVTTNNDVNDALGNTPNICMAFLYLKSIIIQFFIYQSYFFFFYCYTRLQYSNVIFRLHQTLNTDISVLF